MLGTGQLQTHGVYLRLFWRHGLPACSQHHSSGSNHAAHFVTTVNIKMDVTPSGMRKGQKSCAEQQCSNCAKIWKHDFLRERRGMDSKVSVNKAQGKGAMKRSKNWKRPETDFFIDRIQSGNEGETIVEEVSEIWRMSCTDR